MAERYDINRVSEIHDRNIFVDANVLIYWNWASAGSEQKAIDYSTVYLALVKQKNKLFVDFLVISEVVNRIIKEQYKAKIETEKRTDSGFKLSYKQYRNSREGQTTLNDVYTVIKNQIEDFNIIGKSFSEDDIKSFLTVDTLDFIDKGILSICQENNFVLLTNDKDYKNSDIDLLTCNKQVLNLK